MSLVERERTPTELVMYALYALYLYFLGLSFRNTSKALEPFREKKGAMLPCGNGFKSLIPNVFIVVKEYLHF
jgi:hypothetical protein